MAASLQDHFHLLSSVPGGQTTEGEWKAMAPNLKPKALPEYTVIAAPLRALNGKFHAHVLKDGEDPIVFTDWTVLVKCPTWDNVQTWKGYLGKAMYFIPHHHDPNAHDSYAQKVFVARIDEPKPVGPLMPEIHLPVRLIDASQE